MPTFCPECDSNGIICDFCKHYRFNGDEEGTYIGEGCCTLHWLPEDPDGGCDGFYCFRADSRSHTSKEAKIYGKFIEKYFENME